MKPTALLTTLACVLGLTLVACAHTKSSVITDPRSGPSKPALELTFEIDQSLVNFVGTFLVCNPQTFELTDPVDQKKFRMSAHLQSIDGTCGQVDVTCADGSVQSVTACLNKRVDTKCKTPSGREIFVSSQ